MCLSVLFYSLTIWNYKIYKSRLLYMQAIQSYFWFPSLIGSYILARLSKIHSDNATVNVVLLSKSSPTELCCAPLSITESFCKTVKLHCVTSSRDQKNVPAPYLFINGFDSITNRNMLVIMYYWCINEVNHLNSILCWTLNCFSPW